MLPPTLPSHEDLAPHLQRLEAEPGSVILIALELPQAAGVDFATLPAKPAHEIGLGAPPAHLGEHSQV